MKSFADFGIDTKGKTDGEIKTTCPRCSAERKKKTYPCLNVNVTLGVWNCKHCTWSGTLKTGVDRDAETWKPKKIYKRPPAPKVEGLSETWARWLESRGISAQVAERNGLYNEVVYMPQIEEEVDAICWPYVRGGEVIGAKYRDAAKNFRSAAGCERILYGIDDISTETLVWVEGEMDRLSVETAGFVSCVSVPDGAPAPGTKNYITKFDYLDSAAEILAAVKVHVIATDADAPGQALQDELVRRLGAEKCCIVTWPDGCKDANDVLVRHGPKRLNAVILNAHPCPIAGVFGVDDVADKIMHDYNTGIRGGSPTGWACLDPYYTVRPGEWTLITGIPGHGKSEFLDALAVNLAHTQGWRFAVCSPENQPIERHIQKLVEKVLDKPFSKGFTDRMTPDELRAGMAWVSDRFSFVLPEKPTIAEILSKFKALVHRRGIQGAIIDPWNELESTRSQGMTETEYISHSLTQFRQFARINGVHLFIVAHPTKMTKGLDGKYPVPDPYSVSGSAHWRNKADNCITVWREMIGSESMMVQVHVQKIRFKVIGHVGQTTLRYDTVSGRYYDPSERCSAGDFTASVQQEIKEGWQHQ